MQDRFKFRLWDKSISQMSYKVCIGFIDDGCLTRNWVCADTTCGQVNYTDNKLKDIEIMQCTGLKDKNGKLIYEGDILKNNRTNQKYKIIFIEEATTFMLRNIKTDSLISTYQMFEDYKKDLEVIGNIYENQELLEGEGV